jgi:hypothetical protein
MTKSKNVEPRPARRKAKSSSLCAATSSYVSARAKELSRETPKTPRRRSAKAQEEIIKDYLSARSSRRDRDVTSLRTALNLPLNLSAQSASPGKAREEIREELPSYQSSNAKQEEFAVLIPRELGQIPSVKPAQPTAQPAAGWMSLINRVFSWFRIGSAVPKHLRVSETVALGEKRFVAIVHAEGHKFLIGGSATGVSLLTRLDEQISSADASEISPVLAEATP